MYLFGEGGFCVIWSLGISEFRFLFNFKDFKIFFCIYNLFVFENLISSSFSDNYCIFIFIDNGYIWRWSSII